jgi:hypothetical protein
MQLPEVGHHEDHDNFFFLDYTTEIEILRFIAIPTS